MPSLLEQHRVLQARAARLERQLASQILLLDRGAIERLALAALNIGFTREEMEAVFAPALGRSLHVVYAIFGAEAAHAAYLPQVDAAPLAERATASRIAELTDAGIEVARGLLDEATRSAWSVRQLADALDLMLPLTEVQNGYVEAYERKLRTDQRRSLRNRLRDPSFDDAVRSDTPLSEAQIQRMVAAYRQNYVQMRATLIARMELQRAVNATQDAVHRNAAAAGLLPNSARKHWIHMHDDRVREAHVLIPEQNPDGVGIGDAFDSILGPIRFPLDPDADIANTAGCRCSLVYSGMPDR